MDNKILRECTNLENVKEGKMEMKGIGETKPTTIGYGLMICEGTNITVIYNIKQI